MRKTATPQLGLLKPFLVLMVGAIAMLAAACGSDPTPTAAPTPTSMPTPTPDDSSADPTPTSPSMEEATPTPIDTSGWEAEWEEVQALAREEGEVVIAMGGSASRNFGPRFEAFRNEMGIEVVAGTGRGSQQVEKICSERENGVYSTDLWMTGITSTKGVDDCGGLDDDFLSHIILPDIADTANWHQGQHWFPVGLEGKTMAFCASPNVQFSYNTDKVDASTLDSYWDLTEERFVGEIVAMLPWEPGQTNGEFYINHPDLGEEFIRKVILDMDVEFVVDGQRGVDLLAQGAKSIFMYTGNASDDIDELEAEGFPVKNHFGEGFAEGGVIGIGGSCSISVLNDAPHPNAMKVFLNWWYGADNQYGAQSASGDHSLRTDVPTDNLLPAYIRQPGVSYFFPEADPSVDPNNPGLEFQRQLADENGLR